MKRWERASEQFLRRFDYARHVTGAMAPMSPLLLWVIFVGRLVVIVTQLVFAWSLFIQSPPLPPLTQWIKNGTGITPQIYGAWAFIFSLIALWWNFDRSMNGRPLARASGMVIWTTPIFFFVVFTDWYVFFVQPATTKTVAVFYTGMYVQSIIGYLFGLLLGIWIQESRRQQERGFHDDR